MLFHNMCAIQSHCQIKDNNAEALKSYKIKLNNHFGWKPPLNFPIVCRYESFPDSHDV